MNFPPPPPNNNTSATGGYLLPTPLGPYPGGLTFQQFLQTVFVGISGLSPQLVRPRWQPDPPKQPDIDIDWLAIGTKVIRADANPWISTDANQVTTSQRHEDLEVQCAFYGPDAEGISGLVRDGFYIQQNQENLRAANMAFVSANEALRVPDLVNERWIDRWELSVFMRREIIRTYPILTFLSAAGTIQAVVSDHLKTVDWKTN